MDRNTVTRLAYVFLLLLAVPLAANNEAAEATDMGSMDPQAMMEAFTKAAMPGKEHADFAKQTGAWKATVKVWMMGPGTEPQTSHGVLEREVIMGGRVLRESYKGSFGGQPFNGLGHTGYDNVTGRWWSTWNDDMSTGPMVSWGKWSDKEKGIVYEGTSPDPMSGAMVKQRTVIRYPEDDKEVMEMFDMRTGEPVKVMEIVYTRQ